MKKDVPVRHEDKEALRINKRFAMRRPSIKAGQACWLGAFKIPGGCALFDVAHFNPGFRFTPPCLFR